MKKVTVLIPTLNRSEALSATLLSLCFQEYKDFDIIISDQSDKEMLADDYTLRTIIRKLIFHGHSIQIVKNKPKRGIAHQRQFLLEQSESELSLFIDDDLILEPYVVRNMVRVMESKKCGFTGCGVSSLSSLKIKKNDIPEIEFWDGDITPEVVTPDLPSWQRYKLHEDANLIQLAEKHKITSEYPKLYKVAWVGGCTLFDTQKLKSVGGFNFWTELPDNIVGEHVLAQIRVMKKFGGCGILPSGVYDQELPSTLPKTTVDAPEELFRTNKLFQ
jgi:glycosyltransferase involved in cell wall biosynthesis